MPRRETRARAPEEQKGVPCPECGALITVAVNQLLGGDPIRCGRCSLVLTIETGRSRAALDIVRQVAEALNQVERVKHQKL